VGAQEGEEGAQSILGASLYVYIGGPGGQANPPEPAAACSPRVARRDDGDVLHAHRRAADLLDSVGFSSSFQCAAVPNL
jgi:hypothetical protein